MSLTLSCLLWAHPGRETALIEYEDKVLALLLDHNATLLSRARSDGTQGHPLEVQLFEFASQASLDAYLDDPRRSALAPEREASVARTELIPVTIVGQ